MENASKALIIAGAILISILIIGLGVFIYQQAQSTVSKANLNSQINSLIIILETRYLLNRLNNYVRQYVVIILLVKQEMTQKRFG